MFRLNYILLFGIILIMSVNLNCAPIFLSQKNKKIKRAISSYFNDKFRKDLEKGQKSCVKAVKKVAFKFTKWKITHKRCDKESCEIEVNFSEPLMEPVLKKWMKKSLLEALTKKHSGNSDIEERTCEILAKHIYELKAEDFKYRTIKKILKLKKVKDSWKIILEKL